MSKRTRRLAGRGLLLVGLLPLAGCGGIDSASEQFDLHVEPTEVSAATEQAGAHCRRLGKEARITEMRTGPVESGIRKVLRVQCVPAAR
ncbi:MAG: hypothetical protein AB7K86_23385 [Rhodospirillales bacterium]